MKKETYENNLSYIFEADRKNAKYSIDGGNHFMNHGDYCECLAKSVLGFEPKKDANTRADEGWDIEEIKASVKSWNCGLSDRKDLKGLGFDEFCKRFFADELPNIRISLKVFLPQGIPLSSLGSFAKAAIRAEM